MVYFYGQENELVALVGRSIEDVGAEDSTLVFSLSDGSDIVVWIDEDGDLKFRIEHGEAN